MHRKQWIWRQPPRPNGHQATGLAPYPQISLVVDANAMCVTCTSAVAERSTDCLIRRSLTGYLLEMSLVRIVTEYPPEYSPQSAALSRAILLI
jgi:hypothetical protein